MKNYKTCNIRLININDNCDDFVLDFMAKKDFKRVIYICTQECREKIYNKINIGEGEGAIIDSFSKSSSFDDLISFINESIPYDEDIFLDVNILKKEILLKDMIHMIKTLNKMNEKENVKVEVGIM